MKSVQELTTVEINLLVAKAQGVEVEIYEGPMGVKHVTEKLPFCPEGPANAYDRNHQWMYRFYEPTQDWAVAGPIIEKERICVIYSDDSDSADKPYAWAYYPGGDDDFEEVMYERDGETGCEAAMRSFVCKHFGSTIDLQNLPKLQRTAVVWVNGCKEDTYDFSEDNFLEVHVEILAETTAEAEREALKQHAHYFHVDAHFIRWQ